MSDTKAAAMAKLDEILAKLDWLAEKIDAQRAAPAPRAPSDGAARFGNYGRSKGQPVAGASVEDLQYYGEGCKRSLGDPSKERFHSSERILLAAITAELDKRSGAAQSSVPVTDEIPF